MRSSVKCLNSANSKVQRRVVLSRALPDQSLLQTAVLLLQLLDVVAGRRSVRAILLDLVLQDLQVHGQLLHLLLQSLHLLLQRLGPLLRHLFVQRGHLDGVRRVGHILHVPVFGLQSLARLLRSETEELRV